MNIPSASWYLPPDEPSYDYCCYGCGRGLYRRETEWLQVPGKSGSHSAPHCSACADAAWESLRAERAPGKFVCKECKTEVKEVSAVGAQGATLAGAPR